MTGLTWIFLPWCLCVFVLVGYAQTEVGTVRGTLSKAGTGEPIAGAQISLLPPPPGGRNVAVSDNAGRFTLDGVRPGRYSIQAQYEGYLISPPNHAAVSVVNGQTADVALTMVRGSVISGRVRDAYGQPLSDATVNAFALVYHNGFPALQSVAEKMTDDRGEYRLFWLPPGDYYFAVTPRPPARGARGPQAVRTFYSGAANASDATLIAVKAGAEINRIDVDLRVEQLRKISGQVISTVSPAPPPRTAQGVFAIIAQTQNHTADVLLINHDASIPDDGDPGYARALAVDSSSGGQFEFSNILPGSYDLVALVNDQNSLPAIGHASIEVRQQDVSGVKLHVHSGVDVKGKLTLDGGNPGNASLRIMLQPDGALAKFGFISRSVTFGADGAFTVSGIPEGHFRVAVFQEPPGNLYVESVQQNGLNVYDSGFDVGADPPIPIQVIVKSHGGTVEGTASPAAQVALVPTGRKENPALYYGTIADPIGNFTLRGIAPGEYKLFAWQNAPNGAYQNASFLAKHETEGQPLIVTPDSRIRVEIKTVP